MTEIEHLIGLIDPFVRQYGVVAVGIIITLESFGAPLPGESLLIFGSVMAEHGNMSFPLLLLFAWIGGVIGDNIGYFIGKRLGRVMLLRYGEKIGFTPKRLNQVEAVFARYGTFTVAFARFFNVLRQLNGVIAGTLRMDWWRFLLFNALGCALWVLTWGLTGFYLGEHVSNITKFTRSFGLLGAIIVAVLVTGATSMRFDGSVRTTREISGKIRKRLGKNCQTL
jgi:membrane protein DedA with SNARE-associated domain